LGEIVKMDERGRLVVPSEYRNRMETEYFELTVEKGKLILTPVPDPLKAFIGRVTRKKPLRELDEVAEEEAERLIMEEEGNANPRS
jgi:bifunctional DNA-binding transcriptional regulator/antitoxin component of YhaV-PrlF toxin-antitoxin module